MVVAVENGLENIKRGLIDLGYNVVDAFGYKGAVDAYVYENAGLSAISNYNSFAQNSESFTGVLMVNAKNKSINEINHVLKSRVYGENINFI